jgi:hypothetical protein
MAPQDQVQYYFQLAHQYQQVIISSCLKTLGAMYPNAPSFVISQETLFRYESFLPSLPKPEFPAHVTPW